MGSFAGKLSYRLLQGILRFWFWRVFCCGAGVLENACFVMMRVIQWSFVGMIETIF